MQAFTNLFEHISFNLLEEKRYIYLLDGLKVTLVVAFFAALLGILLGLAIAIIKVVSENNKKMWPLRFIANVYVTLIRGTPVMVQLLIIYFIVFASVDVSKTMVAIVAFGINSGAYVSEIIRAGILAVDKGQNEASRSLGLTTPQTYRYIILPQALKNILPALGNEFISLLKETAVVGYIGLQDLTRGGDIIRSQTFDPYVPLITVALVYLAIVMVLSYGLKRLEGRLRRGDQR